MNDSDIEAWNNFVMNSDPHLPNVGQSFRDAAISNVFGNLSNNGGLNSFLTSTYDLDASDVLAALQRIGADIAANQLRLILDGIDVSLPVSTQDERWELLDRYWTDDLDEIETLGVEADKQLTAILQKHVAENKTYYSSLK